MTVRARTYVPLTPAGERAGRPGDGRRTGSSHEFQEFLRDETQVAQARSWLRDCLVKTIPPPEDELLDRASLLLSETFTNAVMHGAGPAVELAFEVGSGNVTITTVGWPAKGSLPRMRTPPTDELPEEGGRGLFLVDALSERWGWDLAEEGQVRVWFTLPLN